MENRTFIRYMFDIDTDTSDFRIVDKYGKRSDIVFEGKFVDLAIIDTLGNNVIIMYGNYLDNPKYGDLFMFDGSKHKLQVLAQNCLAKFEYSKGVGNTLKLTGRQQDNSTVYIFATKDGEYKITHDKSTSDAMSKFKVNTTVIHTFDNGIMLRKNELTDYFGYQSLVFETLDPETGHKEYIGTTNDAHMSYDKSKNPVIKFEDSTHKHTCCFNSDGIKFDLQQQLDQTADNGRSVIYENYYYALVQEEVEVDKQIYYNIYQLKFDNCTDETYGNLMQYFNTEDSSYLDLAIDDDESLITIAEQLTTPPNMTFSQDGSCIDLTYHGQGSEYSRTRIREDGTAFTVTSFHRNNIQ